MEERTLMMIVNKVEIRTNFSVTAALDKWHFMNTLTTTIRQRSVFNLQKRP